MVEIVVRDYGLASHRIKFRCSLGVLCGCRVISRRVWWATAWGCISAVRSPRRWGLDLGGEHRRSGEGSAFHVLLPAAPSGVVPSAQLEPATTGALAG